MSPSPPPLNHKNKHFFFTGGGFGSAYGYECAGIGGIGIVWGFVMINSVGIIFSYSCNSIGWLILSALWYVWNRGTLVVVYSYGILRKN